jgi:hypothetical protein
VTALFVAEALLRDIKVDFGTSGSTAGPTPPGGAPQDPPPPPVTVLDAKKAGVDVAFAAHKKVKAARVSVSYLKSRHGKRFVVVRVASSKTKAKVRIRLIGRHGRMLKVVTRTIRTNRLVSIHVTTKVKKAHVAIVR